MVKEFVKGKMYKTNANEILEFVKTDRLHWFKTSKLTVYSQFKGLIPFEIGTINHFEELPDEAV